MRFTQNTKAKLIEPAQRNCNVTGQGLRTRGAGNSSMKCGSRERNTDQGCEFSFGRKKQKNLQEILGWKRTEADALGTQCPLSHSKIR